MNVKELREKHGLSQQQLADKTGIPKGRINGWEQQNSKPKADDAKVLEQFFASLENKPSQREESGGREWFMKLLDRLMDEKKLDVQEIKESYKRASEKDEKMVNMLLGQNEWLQQQVESLTSKISPQ